MRHRKLRYAGGREMKKRLEESRIPDQKNERRKEAIPKCVPDLRSILSRQRGMSGAGSAERDSGDVQPEGMACAGRSPFHASGGYRCGLPRRGMGSLYGQIVVKMDVAQSVLPDGWLGQIGRLRACSEPSSASSLSIRNIMHQLAMTAKSLYRNGFILPIFSSYSCCTLWVVSRNSLFFGQISLALLADT